MNFAKSFRSTVGAAIVAVMGGSFIFLAPIASADQLFGQTSAQSGKDRGQYIPTISVTPDGCEAWVMDDGAEGYAVNHLTRDGLPVCREANLCGVVNSDQYFATNSYRISAAGKQSLQKFFQSSTAFAFSIIGHTDSRASDAYNMRLSQNRANAVASVAKSVGARVANVRGMGERAPVASNRTAAGMAKNRRVEILCIQ